MSVTTRTIITLERAQLRALKAQARAEGVSVAAFVRRIIAKALDSDRPARVRRSTFERLVGLGTSGRADIGDHHDAALADALRHEHDG